MNWIVVLVMNNEMLGFLRQPTMGDLTFLIALVISLPHEKRTSRIPRKQPQVNLQRVIGFLYPIE